MGDILDGLASSLRAQDGVYPYLAFDQQYYLADDILVKSDRMSMAHAVEVRPPFLDHRIVEFAATLPDSLKIRGSRQKLLLKELMKDKLPASILNRKKVGFDIPAHEWLRGSLRPLLLNTLNEGLAEHAELFRADTIQRYLQLHLERRANLGYHLWGLMILFSGIKISLVLINSLILFFILIKINFIILFFYIYFLIIIILNNIILNYNTLKYII